MTTQSRFSLRGRNPDVLTCIANLSNDEVFTPPELANRMLDTLADAWTESYGGKNIWSDPTVRFLDPCTKSGVFLREITRRLNTGLAPQIPDLEKRVEHIFTKQVFGIAITQLTSLLARRSLYCSKFANGKHSVARSFKSAAGNIWFERMDHEWIDGKCNYCGANQRDYDRGNDLESHAYPFLHSSDMNQRLAEIFGVRMQFDVIIGNPPYQLGQSGGDAIGSFAMPIYQKFVEAAKSLDPRYVTMVTPSRWFAGGRGLDEFRQAMLTDRRLRAIADFPDSREVFAGVDIAGGISYFLWDSSWRGQCRVTTTVGGTKRPPMDRALDEYDVLVRYNEAVPILQRVLSTGGAEGFKSMALDVAPIQPFSLRTNFRGSETPRGLKQPVKLFQNGGVGYIAREDVPRNQEWIDEWKVFLSSTASEHGGQTDKNGMRRVFSRILLGPPGTACTETYLVVSRLASEDEATNLMTYLRTRFVRFLVSLRTNTQHLYSERFAFVPRLRMDREWTDARLYKKFGLTSADVSFIESTIRPMDTGDD
jgi:site-specific DNA-methyltransferase (adenine-specific)